MHLDFVMWLTFKYILTTLFRYPFKLQQNCRLQQKFLTNNKSCQKNSFDGWQTNLFCQKWFIKDCNIYFSQKNKKKKEKEKKIVTFLIEK